MTGAVSKTVASSPIGQSMPVLILDRKVGSVVSVQASKPRAKIVRLSELEEKEVEWLWENRVPIGKLTTYSGDPGNGKSFTAHDMIARVTSGSPWPDKPNVQQPVGDVILIQCEDDLNDTVLPRVLKAGGDVSRVHAIESVECTGKDGEITERGFNLSTDIPVLEAVLESNRDVRLIVIDPVSGYCGNVDTHKDAPVRAMLAPLADLAARYRVAVVMITHMSKAKGGTAISKSMGSIAFVAASRAQWAFVKDHEDPTRRLILLGKLNVSAESTGLAYRIRDGKVDWEGEPVTLTSAEYFAADESRAKPERRKSDGVGPRAEQLIRDALQDGELDKSVIEAMAKDAGVSTPTLYRAKGKIGVKKRSVGRKSMWSLPTSDTSQVLTTPVSREDEKVRR